MSTSNPASTRICPVCEAPNSNLSLFCAECGSSLNAPESDDTATYKPVTASDDDAQRTAAFEPRAFPTQSPAPPRTEDDARDDGSNRTFAGFQGGAGAGAGSGEVAGASQVDR